jgi:hypothetical protein
MRARWHVTLLALALLSPVSGCKPPTVSVGQGAREYVAGDYERVLDRWTRTEQLIIAAEPDNVLTATATFEAWDFRWAYVVRYAEDYRLTIDQRRALLARSLAEVGKVHQFYVALYASRRAYADLAAEKPAWIIRLIDDRGDETAPSEIEYIRKPGAIERTYYPYSTPWRTVFRVRFPVARADGRRTISSNAQWFGLRFAGAQGNTQLVWFVTPQTTETVE